MLKFSFGGPKKLLRRYAQMPLVADFQMVLSHAMEQSGREFGIGWMHEAEQYRLFVRHEAGQVLWRLFEGEGLDPLWTSNQTNLSAVHSEVVVRCRGNQSVGKPQGQKSSLEEAYAGVNLSAVVSRQRVKLEEGTLDQLMQGPLAIKRTYLATTDPIEVRKLIERVSLPVDQVMSALKELVASGLLRITEKAEKLPLTEAEEQLVIQDSFIEAVKARPAQFESTWSKALATPPEKFSSSMTVNIARMQRMTIALMDAMQSLIKQYAVLFNTHAVDQELHILVTDLGEVSERVQNPSGRGSSEVKMIRWRASTSVWSLSARARSGTGIIELFLISAADAFSLGTAEHELQALAKWEVGRFGNELLWLSDGLPISTEEIRATVRTCLRELIRATVNELVRDEALLQGVLPESVAQLHARQSVLEKQNLAQKIVSQQEEIQRRIARDLHDAVIADVTLLKRSISGEAAMDRDTIIGSLDQITARLREICYDLSPSDLKDWGLQTTLEALLDHVGQRMSAEANLVCEIEIPNLDSSVELHIFRILQEALNNCAKYSAATQIELSIKMQNGWLVFSISDNGKGFESGEHQARTKDGGMGMSSMQERVELIRTLYPARLQVFSQPGQGTTTALSIKLP